MCSDAFQNVFFALPHADVCQGTEWPATHSQEGLTCLQGYYRTSYEVSHVACVCCALLLTSHYSNNAHVQLIYCIVSTKQPQQLEVRHTLDKYWSNCRYIAFCKCGNVPSADHRQYLQNIEFRNHFLSFFLFGTHSKSWTKSRPQTGLFRPAGWFCEVWKLQFFHNVRNRCSKCVHLVNVVHKQTSLSPPPPPPRGRQPQETIPSTLTWVTSPHHSTHLPLISCTFWTTASNSHRFFRSLPDSWTLLPGL